MTYNIIITTFYFHFSDLPKDGPYITGDKSTYQFGDTINLNCTSAKSYPASSLHWYINNISVSKLRSKILNGIRFFLKFKTKCNFKDKNSSVGQWLIIIIILCPVKHVNRIVKKSKYLICLDQNDLSLINEEKSRIFYYFKF